MKGSNPVVDFYRNPLGILERQPIRETTPEKFVDFRFEIAKVSIGIGIVGIERRCIWMIHSFASLSLVVSC